MFLSKPSCLLRGGTFDVNHALQLKRERPIDTKAKSMKLMCAHEIVLLLIIIVSKLDLKLYWLNQSSLQKAGQ